jgi:hypothetical protein
MKLSLAHRAKIIRDIIARDDEPPMTAKPYKHWLNSLNHDDLNEYHGLVRKFHPRKKS